MNIKYYIVKNQDINNDGRKEDLILKYRGDQFLGALPLKDYVDIDDYFSKMPVIPQKYYVVYTFHDYNKDKVKDHIVHIFSGYTNNYILSVPINEFMKNAKAYDEYIKYNNNTNIYNEELSKQNRGGKGKIGKKGKGKKGGNPDQLQYMHEKQPNNLSVKNKQSLDDMERLELQELRKQNQQMQQMQQMQMQYPQMQYSQMQYPQMQTANNMFREPSRVDNTNSTLNKFMDATVAGGGLTLGSSIMNSVFDMFSGE